MGAPPPFLTITVDAKEQKVGAKMSDGAEAEGGKLDFDDLKKKIIWIFEDMLRDGRLKKRKELEALGTILYRAIFNSIDNGDVESFFQTQLKNAQTSGQRLRVELTFRSTDPKLDRLPLDRLPWEFLYDPGTEGRPSYFLATKTNLVLSRYVPLDYARQTHKGRESLKILLVTSQPKNLYPKTDPAGIEGTIKNLPNPPFEVIPLNNPSDEIFHKALEDHNPDIVHYLGYGKYDEKENEGYIIFTPDGVEVQEVSSSSFSKLFDRVHPRLVFLHLCQGGKDIKANLAVLGPELIRNYVRTVVAMQYPLPIDPNMAQIFTSKFYQELASGESVDAAVQEGRNRITRGYHESLCMMFASPVLYMHSIEEKLLPPPPPEDKDSKRRGFKQSIQAGAQPEAGKVRLSFEDLADEAFKAGDALPFKPSQVRQTVEELRKACNGKDREIKEWQGMLEAKIKEDPSAEMARLYSELISYLKSRQA